MKVRTLIVLFVVLTASLLSAQTRIYQRGTVTRMRVGRCMNMSNGFLASLSGTSPVPGDDCPEYTLVSDRVVYVVVGKSSNQLIPLAEDIEFRLQKKEVLVHIDDERGESRFAVREMALRSDWERDEADRQRIQRAHQSRSSYIP